MANFLIRGGYWLRGLCAVALALALQQPAGAQEPESRLGFGTDLGFWSGTVDGTRFTLGFNLDYYIDHAFSFGPMLLLTPTGDLTNIAIAGVARYHFRFSAVNLVPFAGIGIMHSDLDKGSGPGRIDRNDTSHYIPLGLTAEYQLSRKLALANTLLVNLHNIDLSPSLPRDTTSVTLLFGFRFGP